MLAGVSQPGRTGSIASKEMDEEIEKSFHHCWVCLLVSTCSFSSSLSAPLHSGLNLAPVARLRSSWEKLPSKYEKLFGDLQDVFDPSRNMAKYRNILSSQSMQPPIIPLFPVVKKDLTFLHEGGQKTSFRKSYSDTSSACFAVHSLLCVHFSLTL